MSIASEKWEASKETTKLALDLLSASAGAKFRISQPMAARVCDLLKNYFQIELNDHFMLRAVDEGFVELTKINFSETARVRLYGIILQTLNEFERTTGFSMEETTGGTNVDIADLISNALSCTRKGIYFHKSFSSAVESCSKRLTSEN